MTFYNMVQCFEFSWFKKRFCCNACPVISYSSVPVTRSLLRQLTGLLSPFAISHTQQGNKSLVHNSVVSKLVQDVFMWVWACGRSERQVFCHACKSAVTTRVFSRHDRCYRGMKEALNCAERKNRACKSSVSSMYKREAELKTNFPLGFLMLSTYFTPAKSWFLCH